MRVVSMAADRLLTVLPPVLLAVGVFYLIRLRFFFYRSPLSALKALFRPEGAEKNPWAALTLSLAGTLGIGNIVGVAVALSLGGPGSVFWIAVSALASAVLKYAEVTLALRYRIALPDGSFSGSPMLYMEKGLGRPFGRFFAFLFAAVGLSSSFCLGNAVQIKAAADAAFLTLQVPPLLFGIVCAVFCLAVMLGGVSRVSKVTLVVIPLCSLTYIALSLYCVTRDLSRIPYVWSQIWDNAFTPAAGMGGVGGFLCSDALRHGIAKGTFSHEAGSGTSPMSHACAETSSAAREGLFAILEVFFDTLILCTLTAFVILLSDVPLSFENGGMAIVLAAFSRYLGEGSRLFLAASMTVFAVSTVLCWSFYGTSFLRFFTKKKTAETVYLLLYGAATALGAVLSPSFAWAWADFGVCLMTVLNLIALIFLSGEVREETEKLFPRKNRRRDSPSKRRSNLAHGRQRFSLPMTRPKHEKEEAPSRGMSL